MGGYDPLLFHVDDAKASLTDAARIKKSDPLVASLLGLMGMPEKGKVHFLLLRSQPKPEL